MDYVINKAALKKAYLLNVIVFLMVHLYALVALPVLKIIPVSELVHFFSTPGELIALTIGFGVSIALTLKMKKEVATFESGKGSLEQINKAIKKYQMVSLMIANTFALVFSIYIGFEYNKDKIPGLTASIILIYMSGVFTLAQMFYILFFQTLERAVENIPLVEKYKSMPLVARGVLICFVSFSAVLMIFIAPLITPLALDLPIDADIITRIFYTAIVGIIIGIIDVYLQSKGTEIRLKRIMGYVEKVAKGDYREEELPYLSRDEYGLLITNLNAFHEHTKELLGKLKANTEVASITANELSVNMGETTSSVESINTSIGNVMEQMTIQAQGTATTEQEVQKILDNIQTLNMNIEDQSAQVSQSSSAVEEMVANVQSVSGIVEKSMQIVTSLEEKANYGKDIVENTVSITRRMIGASEGLLEASTVIQNIASQTNLLAMNAAIEAAHAGDVGAGFAVVADEIRKLAEDSNQQGKNITNAMNELIEAIREVANSTETVQQEFDNIFELTESVGNRQKVISNAMQEQVLASESVLDSIQRMRNITVTVRSQADDMKAGSDVVADEMHRLVSIGSTISRHTSIMETETMQIREKVQKSISATEKNTESVKGVISEMGKFQI